MKPITQFGDHELAEALTNNGYKSSRADFYDYQYIGRDDKGQFVFVIAVNIEDSTVDISKLFISLNNEGVIVGEWAGCPLVTDLSYAQADLFMLGVRSRTDASIPKG